MKNKLIMFFAFLLLFTGCGKKNTLTCKSEEKVQDDIYKTSIKITFKDDKVNKAKLSMDVELSDASMKYYDLYYNSFTQTFDEFSDKDGIKLDFEKVDNGYNVSIDVDYEKFDGKFDMIVSSLNKEQTKVYYENAKYTCK